MNCFSLSFCTSELYGIAKMLMHKGWQKEHFESIILLIPPTLLTLSASKDIRFTCTVKRMLLLFVVVFTIYNFVLLTTLPIITFIIYR